MVMASKVEERLRALEEARKGYPTWDLKTAKEIAEIQGKGYVELRLEKLAEAKPNATCREIEEGILKTLTDMPWEGKITTSTWSPEKVLRQFRFPKNLRPTPAHFAKWAEDLNNSYDAGIVFKVREILQKAECTPTGKRHYTPKWLSPRQYERKMRDKAGYLERLKNLFRKSRTTRRFDGWR